MQAEFMLTAARSFLATRWRRGMIHDRISLKRYQLRRLAALQRHLDAHIPFYSGMRRRPFEQWPITSKAEMVERFAEMNVAGIDTSAIRHALAGGAERVGGFVVGKSTGTSGNRGYYLISEAERFVWLGVILAKALPDALLRRHRVALALPGLSSLYRSATHGSRIVLGFFDLAIGIDRWADDLVRFDPDTIVAPPKVLRWLAEHRMLQAENVFSGAEVLDPLDRAVIETATGRIVREIYMATEGLFGVSCPKGTLHLAEDVVFFEWESVGADSRLVSPIVTDFTRRSQALVRYRMNDLLDLSEADCACGSPYQAVRAIEGRLDDVFQLVDSCGLLRMVTPDVMRNAVVDAHPAIQDYRIEQTSPSSLRVCLETSAPAAADDLVRSRLEMRFAGMGLGPDIAIVRGIEPCFERKLRRIRRLA